MHCLPLLLFCLCSLFSVWASPCGNLAHLSGEEGGGCRCRDNITVVLPGSGRSLTLSNTLPRTNGSCGWWALGDEDRVLSLAPSPGTETVLQLCPNVSALDTGVGCNFTVICKSGMTHFGTQLCRGVQMPCDPSDVRSYCSPPSSQCSKTCFHAVRQLFSRGHFFDLGPRGGGGVRG